MTSLDLEGKNQELIDELVSLSLQHGIITSYTSFLADDQARPNELADVRRHRERAARGLERLSEVSGEFAFRQRLSKSALRSRLYAPAVQLSDAEARSDAARTLQLQADQFRR